VRAGARSQLQARALPPPAGEGARIAPAERQGLLHASLAARARAFLWLRVIVVGVLFALTATTGGVAASLPAERGGHLLLLAGALGVSGVFAAGLRRGVSAPFLSILQVAWDLFFSAAWIYATGGTESVFLFLYLLVIIEASFLLEVHGVVLTAILCALCYGVEMHLEFARVLVPMRGWVPGPAQGEPGVYPVAGLNFLLAAIGLTAWLSNNLKERLTRTRRLLQEKTENLQDLLSLNDSIVRCVRSGIITLDADRRITSINEAASQITGYTQKEIVGLSVEAFLGEVPPEALQRAGATPPYPSRWEQSFRGRHNAGMCLGCSSAVLRDHNDESFGHLIIFQDLSPYKRIEEELRRAERLAAIGELAAGLAHEIRNPLASLYGSIQLLQGELDLDASQQRLMKIILQESERLNGLISNFLQFASPRTLHKGRLALLPVVEEVLALFRKGPQMREEIRIAVDVPPELEVLADEKQMTQILWNLLLNAAQAMESGWIRIRAQESTEAGGKPVSRIQVEDTGQGIPPENMGKIFDPFFTSRDEGTGLGLAVVYRIVENHGGRIHVESAVGKGTTFRIDLPLAESDVLEGGGAARPGRSRR